MSSQVTIGVIALVLVSTSGVMAALAVEKVNGELPKEEQIEPMGWYFSKTLRLHREYRRRTQLMQIRQRLIENEIKFSVVDLAAVTIRQWKSIRDLAVRLDFN